MHVAQLLPDLEQARLLRTLLTDVLTSKDDTYTEEERDMAAEMLAHLTAQMRRNRSPK